MSALQATRPFLPTTPGRLAPSPLHHIPLLNQSPPLPPLPQVLADLEARGALQDPSLATLEQLSEAFTYFPRPYEPPPQGPQPRNRLVSVDRVGPGLR